MSEPSVIVRQQKQLGRLTLNRPAAINALTAEMVTIVARTLDGWSLMIGSGPW